MTSSFCVICMPTVARAQRHSVSHSGNDFLISGRPLNLAVDNTNIQKEPGMMLSKRSTRTSARLFASASFVAVLTATSNVLADDGQQAHNGASTRSPIKHVITVIGENRSFDHVFGLYQPRRGETVSNLLSKGILRPDGTPGPQFSKARQFEVAPQASYYVGVDGSAKTPYITLPPPDLAGTPTARAPRLPRFQTSHLWPPSNRPSSRATLHY